MRFRKFGEFFPEEAIRTMVPLWIDPPRQRLPVKAYWLLEYYCDEPGCDCRTVTLDVVSEEHRGRVFASIKFGWETPAFYRRWAGTRDLGGAGPLRRGVLDSSALNCDWADALLRQVRKEVFSDPKAVRRFIKHYEMVKKHQRKQAKAEARGKLPDYGTGFP